MFQKDNEGNSDTVANNGDYEWLGITKLRSSTNGWWSPINSGRIVEVESRIETAYRKRPESTKTT